MKNTLTILRLFPVFAPFLIPTLFGFFAVSPLNRAGAEEPNAKQGVTYYVAPGGDDSATGSAEKPLASVAAARDRIRSDKSAGNTGPWTVLLAEGVYPLTAPVDFGPEDSGTAENPIRYRGTGDRRKTVLSGGIELVGWRAATPEESAKNGAGEIWACPLPERRGATLYFEQLFVGNRRATRARWPNEGFLHPAEIQEEFPMDKKSRKPVEPTTRQEIVAKPGDLDFLQNVPAAELRFGQFVIHHHWDTTRRILLGFDAPTGTLTLKGAPMKAWNPWRTSSQYYLENVRPAFDRPGEWFYDGLAKTVFYRPLPDEKIDAVQFVVPRNGLTQLLRVQGKQDVPVVGLSFENLSVAYSDTPRRAAVMKNAALDESVTGPLDLPGPSQFEPAQAANFTDAVVAVDWAQAVSFTDFDVRHVGEYGLWLKNAERCVVRGSELSDLGAGGIRLGGGTRAAENVLDNNLIRRGGRFHASAVAVWIGNNTFDNQVTHNDIYDFFYTGVSAGWTWGYQGGAALRNRIEFNRIHQIGQFALADMGGVYTLGTSTGTRVGDNVIFDIKSYGYGGWGLYTDEGSEGILMENNLVYDTTDGSFHQHYGKENVIRNNILADSSPHQIAATRVEDHLSFTFEKNIVYWTRGTAFGYNVEKVRADIRSNLWWKEGGETEFRGKTHDQWLEEGHDPGGIVADPKFIDASGRDYRLLPDSPAEKIGFVPFDSSRAGLTGDSAWTDRAKEFPNFLVFPEEVATPDGMAICPKTGDLIVACPNFGDSKKPACLVRITPEGKISKWVDVPVLAETKTACPMGIAFAPDGSLFVADNQDWAGGNGENGEINHGRLLRLLFDRDKIAETIVVAEGISHPNGVKIRDGFAWLTVSSLPKIKDGPDGLLQSGVYRFPLDAQNVKITNTRSDPNLWLTVTTRNKDCPYGLDGITFDPAGNLLLGNFGDGEILRVTREEIAKVGENSEPKTEVYAKSKPIPPLNGEDGKPDPNFLVKATDVPMRTTDGLSFDPFSGELYVADFSNNAVVRVLPGGKRVEFVAKSPDRDGLAGDLNQPGEPCLWNGKLAVTCFDMVSGPDKVNKKHDPRATIVFLKP